MANTMFAFWQMVWQEEVSLLVTLSSIDSQECLPFWPSSGQVGETLSWENPTKSHQIRVVMIEEIDAPSRRAIRVSLEVMLITIQKEFHLHPEFNILYFEILSIMSNISI